MGKGRLDGKVALITGAGEGMGRAAAVLFAREGARVGVLEIDRERAEATTAGIDGEGGTALPLVADVSSQEDGARSVRAIVEEYGALHVLYNSAGVWLRGDGPVAELEESV